MLPARLWVQFALLANLWVQSLLHADFRWTKNQKLRKLSAARLRVHFGRVMGFVTGVCFRTWRRSKWPRAMRIKRRAMSGWSALSCARKKHSGRSAWLGLLCSRLWRWWHGFICSGNAPLCGGRLGVLDATASAASFARRAAAGRRAGVDRHATGEPGNAQTAEFVFGAVGSLGGRIGLCGHRGALCRWN